MSHSRWPILLGIFLIVAACCILAACTLGGLVWWIDSAFQPSPAYPLAAQEATPARAPLRRDPSAAERETALQLTRTAVPPRDLIALAKRLHGLPPELVRAPQLVPPSYALGDKLTFWIHDVETISFFTATATLQYVTPHAYWWIEEGYQVPYQDLERSAENFEDQTYPTNQRLFGREWNPGIDGDPHVYIFLGNVPGVGGYFSGPDEYPATIGTFSNEHEMFYINLEDSVPGNSYFDGVLAHEFQHMIHWAMDRDEDTWVNEGLSELASMVNGYDVGGSAGQFARAPDTQLNAWPELEDSAPNYGASYLFLAYFLGRYGEQAVQRLVSEPANGIAGFEAVLRHLSSGTRGSASPAHRQFDALFADWVIANYLDDEQAAGARYGYADLKVEPPGHAAEHEEYPVQHRSTVHQYAADYVLLQGTGDFTVEFTGSLTVPLLGNEPRTGLYQWWSNRGDESDTTLTRAFDLQGLSAASLQAWMWYDLEPDYDYGYVQVSSDGGKTWDLLENEHTVTTNPAGNSYGPAFTGTSGRGTEPRWVLETFDLSPYAGEQILLRFEVITDEALNHPGLCVDQILIPELGYSYDADNGDGGWQAEGWLRVTSHIPQQFIVQLITLGREPRVERLPLGPDMVGRFAIERLGAEAQEAVLVVSATTPFTTEPAVYSYRISRR